jgi:hypothetical protein
VIILKTGTSTFGTMAKQKNPANKKKHTRLLNQKKAKKRNAKILLAERLKEVMRKAKESEE